MNSRDVATTTQGNDHRDFLYKKVTILYVEISSRVFIGIQGKYSEEQRINRLKKRYYRCNS